MSTIKELLFGQQSAALTDNGSIQKIDVLQNNTARHYGEEQLSSTIDPTLTGSAKASDVSAKLKMTNDSVQDIIAALSQENSMISSPVWACDGMSQVGVDQYEGSINLARMSWSLKMNRLPKLVKIPSTTLIFRPEGGLIINGSSVTGYNAANLASSFIAGGVLNDKALAATPILGYDIKTRPFDSELGESSLNIESYEQLEYHSGDPATMTGVLNYHAEFRQVASRNELSHLVCVPALTQNVYTLSSYTPETREDGIYYSNLESSPRHSDLEISLYPDVSSGSDNNLWGLKISGSNTVVYLTPIIPTKEVLTRVLNNMVKDGSAYVNALMNVYNNR